jgi:hypothetical protein
VELAQSIEVQTIVNFTKAIVDLDWAMGMTCDSRPRRPVEVRVPLG